MNSQTPVSDLVRSLADDLIASQAHKVSAYRTAWTRAASLASLKDMSAFVEAVKANKEIAPEWRLNANAASAVKYVACLGTLPDASDYSVHAVRKAFATAAASGTPTKVLASAAAKSATVAEYVAYLDSLKAAKTAQDIIDQAAKLLDNISAERWTGDEDLSGIAASVQALRDTLALFTESDHNGSTTPVPSAEIAEAVSALVAS